MSKRFTPREEDAVASALKKYPDDGQRTLARRLVGSAPSARLYDERVALAGRGYASIYGAIRRHDADRRIARREEPDPDSREQHADALRRLDLRPGDKVRVERKADANERGWRNSWATDMNPAVGRTGKVRTVDGEFGVSVVFTPDHFEAGSGFRYPAFVLTVVERAGHRQPQTA
jgi:hypothetical protein